MAIELFPSVSGDEPEKHNEMTDVWALGMVAYVRHGTPSNRVLNKLMGFIPRIRSKFEFYAVDILADSLRAQAELIPYFLIRIAFRRERKALSFPRR